MAIKEWNFRVPRRCSKEPCCGWEPSLFNALRMDARRWGAENRHRSHLEAFVKFREGAAVLWFSDLHNYTRISDSAPHEEIIPFLNDYVGDRNGHPRTLTKDRTGWLRAPVIGSKLHVV